MKKHILSILLTAIIIAGCSSDGGEGGDRNTGVAINSISMSGTDGESSISTVSAAFHVSGLGYEVSSYDLIASSAFDPESPGFTIDLSQAGIPTSHLKPLAELEIFSDGLTFSDAGAKGTNELILIGYSIADHVYGDFFRSTIDGKTAPFDVGDVYIYYMYADRAVTVRGQSGDSKFELDLAKGWNEYALACRAGNNEYSMIKLYTNKIPAGIPWKYFSWP